MQVREGWFAAEGTRHGMPILTRGRKPESIVCPQNQFPHLLCVDLHYAGTDLTALPTVNLYDGVARFEKDAIDRLEEEDGILLLVETGEGKVRYFLYTASPDALANKVQDGADASLRLEFSGDFDPDWSVYREMIGRLGFAQKL